MIQPEKNCRTDILRLFCVLFCVSFAMVPVVAQGAILYLQPDTSQHHQGDTFIIGIKLNTEGEYINAVKVDLAFPPDVLEIKDFSKGDSVLTLWVEEPSFSNREGKLSFIAGVPAGYQGWDGLLARIVMRARGTDAKLERGTDAEQDAKQTLNYAKIEFLESSQVLLNDGLGTPAGLTTEDAALTILPEKLETSSDAWQEELKKDTIPPEPFEPEIHKTPSVFEGRYFVIFSTTDKQTGLNYYQVKEGKKNWQKTSSPYLLEDQGLRSIIKVKAVDKAGNERLAEYIPSKKPFPYWLIILIIIGLVVIGWIAKKFLNPKS